MAHILHMHLWKINLQFSIFQTFGAQKIKDSNYKRAPFSVVLSACFPNEI